MDRVALSRGDTNLRVSDVALLSGANWLNDNLMTFFFSHLTELHNDDSILLVDGSVRRVQQWAGRANPISAAVHAASAAVSIPHAPCTQVAFFLANCDAEDALVVTAPLHVASRALILFAVNDCPSVSTANGGSHWTLLAYRKSSGAFTHYDSAGRTSNASTAARVAKTLKAALGLPAARVHEAPAPQQANGYDCGLHVLVTARLLCDTHRRTPGQEPTAEELAAHVTPAAAHALRAEMQQLIATLAAEDVPWDD